jgi:hypothetical protein
VGLWSGELQRSGPALPARHTDQDAIRYVTPVQLAQLTRGAALEPVDTDQRRAHDRRARSWAAPTCRARSRSRTSWRASGPGNTA